MGTNNTVGVTSSILEILGENPNLSYSKIAVEVGVTRERVRQIAKKNGYPPRSGILKLKICPVCGGGFNTRNLYCSRICAHKAKQNRIVIACRQCGKPIERTPGSMRNRSGNYFCNRSCFTKWLSHSSFPKTNYI